MDTVRESPIDDLKNLKMSGEYESIYGSSQINQSKIYDKLKNEIKAKFSQSDRKIFET